MTEGEIDRAGDLNSAAHHLDARVKILFVAAFVVVNVGTPREAFVAFALYAGLLATLMVAARLPAGYVLRRVAVVLPFVALVAAFMPFLPPGDGGAEPMLSVWNLHVWRGGLLALWNVSAKATLSALAVTWLTSTTGFAGILAGLERLGVPHAFVGVLRLTYRYLFLLVDEAMRMKRAADSRGYRGRWVWQARAVGGLIGTLFLRSYERGERVFWAMQARGYMGSAPVSRIGALRAADTAFLGCGLVALIAIRVGVR